MHTHESQVSMNTTAEASFADDLYAAIVDVMNRAHMTPIPMLRCTPNTPTRDAFRLLDETLRVAIQDVCCAHDLPRPIAGWLHVVVATQVVINMFRPFGDRIIGRLNAENTLILRRALCNDERFAGIVELLSGG